jgi:hypothetical protein
MSSTGILKRTAFSLLVFLAAVILQTGIYYVFLHPVITTWGATEKEVAAKMPGDELAPFTSATRAININAPHTEVWKWMVQLGCDRGGFYSYSFLENLYGEELPSANRILPEFQPMPLGRVVTAYKPDSSGKGELSWKVVAVEKEKYFVLQGWGCFLLTPVPGGKSRLVVRTHGSETDGFLDAVEDFVMVPLHYLMERKMLMGIRDQAQAGGGVNVSDHWDLLWFLGFVFSGICILVLLFVGQGITGFIISNILGALWLISLLILPPQSVYSLVLSLLAVLAVTWLYLKSKRQKKSVS